MSALGLVGRRGGAWRSHRLCRSVDVVVELLIEHAAPGGDRHRLTTDCALLLFQSPVRLSAADVADSITATSSRLFTRTKTALLLSSVKHYRLIHFHQEQEQSIVFEVSSQHVQFQSLNNLSLLSSAGYHL